MPDVLDRPDVLSVLGAGRDAKFGCARGAKAGFVKVFSVPEGFEGELDAHKHRGQSDGRRFHALPCIQD